jgi:hypothetical protein
MPENTYSNKTIKLYNQYYLIKYCLTFDPYLYTQRISIPGGKEWTRQVLLVVDRYKM